MSAILVLRQRNSVHLLVDTAAYTPDGILVSNNFAKCSALPTLNAAIACTGPAPLGPYFANHLPYEFASFDELVERGEEIIPTLFEDFAIKQRDGDALSSLYIVGWHDAAQRPAAYTMELWTDESTRMQQVLSNGEQAAPERFKLTEQILTGTQPDAERVKAAGLRIPVDENDMRPDLDLLHLMEVQRHEKIEGAHWVGGKAVLTSIDKQGITQRVLHHWKEDEVGELITPPPINWKAWREARTVGAANIPAGLSRLQRERMEKKARKGTLT